eukprot:gene6431-10439_t
MNQEVVKFICCIIFLFIFQANAQKNDHFSGSSLDTKVWSILHSTKATVVVSSGSLVITPSETGNSNIWFNNGEGVLVYQTVSSNNFNVTTIAHARSTSNPTQPPPISYRLGGVLIRSPGSSDGTRESIHCAVGGGDNTNQVAVEDKTTTNSNSDFRLHTVPQPDVELRMERKGSVINCYWRSIGVNENFKLMRSHTHNNLPQTVQVGLMAYSLSSPANIQLKFDSITFSGSFGNSTQNSGSTYHSPSFIIYMFLICFSFFLM